MEMIPTDSGIGLSGNLGNQPGAGIPPKFLHCMSYISKAATFLAVKEHPDALKLGLIRLRLSRWHTQIKKGQGIILPEDKPTVVNELENLYKMLGDAPNATRGGLPRRELLNAIDLVVRDRLKGLTIAETTPGYRGNILWSPDQYKGVAEIIGTLEEITGAQGLRDLSAEDIRNIDPYNAYSNALKGASADVDPWMTAVFEGLRVSSGVTLVSGEGSSQHQEIVSHNPERNPCSLLWLYFDDRLGLSDDFHTNEQDTQPSFTHSFTPSRFSGRCSNKPNSETTCRLREDRDRVQWPDFGGSEDGSRRETK